MKKIFRKNQIIITALALMIAVAGYISYTRANVAENDAIQTAGETNDISDGEQIGEIFTDTEDNTQAASAADAQAEERSGRIQKTPGPDLRPSQRPMGEMQRKYRIREKRCRRQPRHRVWRLHRR